MPTDMAVYMAERRSKRRNDLIKLFGGKCKTCGSTEELEFNHLDRTAKLFNLSGSALDKSWQTILEEAAKCELVCNRCHLAYTREQYAAGEIVPHNKNTAPYVHGTMRCYQETGCKCSPCKAAKKLYRAKGCDYRTVVS